MQTFKVIGGTIEAVGETIVNSAQLLSLVVGDEGLKHTTRQSFKLVNSALDESVEMALLETEYNLAEFKRTHAKKVGRPAKT
jgi:hypothetical protein